MPKKNYFESIASRYEQKMTKGVYGFLKKHELNAVLGILSDMPFKSLIDIGSGPGIYLKAIREKWHKNHFVAVDQSEEMIFECKRSGFTTCQSSLETLNLHDKFDVILALGIWEFIEQKEEAVSRLLQLAHPQTRLIILVPSCSPLNLFYYFFHLFNNKAISFRTTNHYRLLFERKGWQLSYLKSPTCFSRLLVFNRSEKR